MKINIKKTKTMVVRKKPNSPKINIAIDGQHIELVSNIYVWEIRKGDQEKNNDRRLKAEDPVADQEIPGQLT